LNTYKYVSLMMLTCYSIEDAIKGHINTVDLYE